MPESGERGLMFRKVRGGRMQGSEAPRGVYRVHMDRSYPGGGCVNNCPAGLGGIFSESGG